MYLVVIVPPDNINGDQALLPDLAADIEKVFSFYGWKVHVELVLNDPAV